MTISIFELELRQLTRLSKLEKSNTTKHHHSINLPKSFTTCLESYHPTLISTHNQEHKPLNNLTINDVLNMVMSTMIVKITLLLKPISAEMTQTIRLVTS